jgi:hypothetical protein
MLGFFLQIIIVSLCSLVLLMRMVRDRKRALKRGKEEEGRSPQGDEILEEGETIQRLFRDNDDNVDV